MCLSADQHISQRNGYGITSGKLHEVREIARRAIVH
jgi:hypothetical protein